MADRQSSGAGWDTSEERERENYGQRKKERRWKLDVRTAEQNLGRELNELNDEIILEINKLARDLILMDFRDVTTLKAYWLLWS